MSKQKEWIIRIIITVMLFLLLVLIAITALTLLQPKNTLEQIELGNDLDLILRKEK